jgi:signal transduction histidine kinase
MALKKNITLDMQYSYEAPMCVFQDRSRLKQIIINLMGNAFKFTLTGSITIVVELRALEDMVSIGVRDTGLGIRQEDQNNLFKAFGKGVNIENKKYNKQGVGLGLLISNIIAKSLNVQQIGLSFCSTYGKGIDILSKLRHRIRVSYFDRASGS